MSHTIIRLLSNGELEEYNLHLDKTEKYKLSSLLDKLNLEDDIYYTELYQWDLENKKKLILIGSKLEEGEENVHQLPISKHYQYYGDLYALIILDNKYCPIDLEIFENIYNALYLNMEDESDSEPDLYSSDEDLDTGNLEEDELNIIEDYGDEDNEDSTDNSEDEELEEKKKKTVKRKKIIKIKEAETKDVLYEEIEIQVLKKETRIKCLDILYSIIENISSEDKLYLQDVERHIFNQTLQKSIERNIIPTWNIVFKNIYINKVRSIYTNLISNNYVKNNRLIQRFNKKEFTPEQLVTMNPQELFPENWKELIDEKYRRDKILYETKKEAMTDQFKCSKCHSRETCYFEMQTRSADEPMTIFITCLNCGKRWKN
jgi:transcription elongation factor S-II